MATIHVRLFGKLGACYDGRAPAALDPGKVHELFGYLLLFRDRPHSRDALAGLLWGDSPTAQAKKYLRQALWQLQAALAAPPAGEAPLFLVEPDWVRLNPGAAVALDVAQFEASFAAVEGTPGARLAPDQGRTLEQAVRLYQGDLLEDCFEDWCLFERTRLQAMLLAMLDKLMGWCEANREYETAMTYGARILRHDRASERTHRRLMRLHFLAGDRTAALRQYARCAAALDDELGVPPARSTVTLYEQIRADALVAPAPPPPVPVAAPPRVATALADPMERLAQVRAALVEIQSQIQHDIQAIDQALHGQP